MSNKLQLRRDTAANWETAKTVLAQGEIGLILDDNGKVVGQKIGDGVTTWTELSYFTTDDGASVDVVQNTGDSTIAVMSQKAVSDLDFAKCAILGVKSPYVIKNSETLTEIDYTSIEENGDIRDGKIVASNNYYHTRPIALSKGECLLILCNHPSPIWETDEEGSYYIKRDIVQMTLYRMQWFKYIALEDCHISVAYYKTGTVLPAYTESVVRMYKYRADTDYALYRTIFAIEQRLGNISNDVVTAINASQIVKGIAEIVQSTNLFNRADENLIQGSYINTGGSMAPNDKFFITGYIEVEEGKTYYAGLGGAKSIARTHEFYDGSKIAIAGSFHDASVSIMSAPEGAKYMRCSVLLQYLENYQINEGELKPYEDYYSYTQVKLHEGQVTYGNLSNSVKALISTNINSFRDSAELVSANVLTLPSIHVGKCNVLSAKIQGTIEAISVGVGYLSNETNYYRDYASHWAEIDATHVRMYRAYNSAPSLITEKEHNIILTNSTTVEISNGDKTSKIRIYNDLGGIYEQDIEFGGVGTPFIQNNGNSSISVNLSYFPREINKTIWAFGDSFFSFVSDKRWPYYFEQYGYTDFLSNNQPGLSPNTASIDLENLLTIGKPKYLLWCLGMNGDTKESLDTEGNYIINSYQKTNIDKVIATCEKYGIIPVLATIPTVPERQKTGYNNYIKSLGVRYIDFASAVGANSLGEWNEGLLSSDNVHPTANGAKVLASQVLIDFPELTIKD